jgi:energy-coupling factor transporter ATP-binding protein EcfA2
LSEFQLNNINLIVGNNASGKTRTLNVINGFSRLLQNPKIIFNSGEYFGLFTNNNFVVSYKVELSSGNVSKEEMSKDGKLLLKRDKNGEGQIYNEDLKRMMSFKIPLNELVACRRDEIQFPYLEYLFNWASNTKHFRFAKEDDKNTLALIESNTKPTENSRLKNVSQAITVFRHAKGIYRNEFINLLINDLNNIGYNISDIDVGVMHSIKVDSPVGNKVVGLRLKEGDRDGLTDQNEMSDGLFRALSILIHYNFYILEKKNLTILVDDIGEGLDFE